MKKIIPLTTLLVLAINPYVPFAESEGTDVFLPSEGILNESTHEIKQTSDDTIEHTFTDGFEVTGNTRIKDDEINGNLVIPSKNERYKIEGNLNNEETNKTDETDVYTGNVTNDDELKFEAFVYNNDNGEKIASINIFDLVEEDGNVERKSPFTIILDYNNNQKIETYDENIIFDQPITSDSEREVSILTDGSLGSITGTTGRYMRTETQAWEDEYDAGGNHTPWRVGAFTEPDNAKQTASNPDFVNEVRVHDLSIDVSGDSYTTFAAAKPLDNSHSSFDIPFIIDHSLDDISVYLSSVSVDASSSGWNVAYDWHGGFASKDAYGLEYGESDGLIAESKLSWSTQASGDFLNLDQEIDMTYELFGDIREYHTTSTSHTVYYQ
ncbi:hypothetical protein [Texcoconibacillus texcoconensis]|uniref:Uncharacterized protein n=1 Tax=Texcoconibacillus texcoconensis TaxID=1095777 RepID=A0A840QPL4_9BACI|nr:hypothetical protein [Texcoconibacillus texcoconensis]MBB5173356.1 hypothetical protein [Texcoconibacillus texcoconensis]